MNLGFVAMRQKAEGEALVKRTEGEVVRRRQKRQTVIETSCHHCCHCCKMRSRRLSYQELSIGGEHKIPRPRSLFVVQEPLYEELGPPSPPNLTSMQTLDVRLRESHDKLVERGVRDFQDYPDSGLGSEQGSLGRLSTDSHVIMSDEVTNTQVPGVSTKQGRPGWLVAARTYLRRLARRPHVKKSAKVEESSVQDGEEQSTGNVV